MVDKKDHWKRPFIYIYIYMGGHDIWLFPTDLYPFAKMSFWRMIFLSRYRTTNLNDTLEKKLRRMGRTCGMPEEKGPISNTMQTSVLFCRSGPMPLFIQTYDWTYQADLTRKTNKACQANLGPVQVRLNYASINPQQADQGRRLAFPTAQDYHSI